MSKKIEGLCLEIQALTKDGHEKLAALDMDSACELFERAKKLAITLDEGFTLRACYFNLGACYVAKGEAPKGLELLLKALPPERDVDGVENCADLNYNLGIAYDAVGKHKDALDCYEAALKDYQDSVNTNPSNSVLEMMAETLVKMAVDCSTLGDIPKASSCYTEAAEIYAKLGDQTNQLLALSCKVTLLAELGDTQGYEAILPSLNDLCQTVENTQLKAKIFNDIGLVYNADKSYEKATKCFEHALMLVTEDDVKMRAVLYQNLGATYNQLTHYNKAIPNHLQALDLVEKVDGKSGKTQVLCNVGFAYSKLGELLRSAKAFQQAHENAKLEGDKNGQLQAIEGYAAICFLQGDYDSAVSHYKMALALLAAIGTIDSVAGDRIVSKLSDALECHLMHSRGVKRQHSKRTSEKTPHLAVARKDSQASDTSSRKIGRGRPGRPRHRLIARGLDPSQTTSEESESGSESDSSVDSNYSGSSSERRRAHMIPHWGYGRKQQGKTNENTEQPITGAGMSSTRAEDDLDETMYEKPMDIVSPPGSPAGVSQGSNMSRAHKEALLAEYSQTYSQPLPPVPKEEQKNTSAMCVVQ